MRFRSIGVAGALFLGSWPSQAEAQATRAPTSGSSSTTHAPAAAGSPPSIAPIAGAQARFRRAIELHDEGNLDACRTELKRAYETAPNYKVLFNLAQVEFELLDYPAALATFERYLAEGGDRIPKDRRAQVQSDMEKLRGRLGRIEIAVNVEGARVMIDDVAVGTTPLRDPVLVSAGRRRITVSHAAFTPETRVVDVAGGDDSAMTFELTSPVPPASAPPASAPPAPEGAVREPPAPAPAPPIETPPPKLDTNHRSVPWLGWVATAALAGGAGVTGALAWQRSQQLGSDRARFGVERSELDNIQKEATALALASDICAGTSVFAGLVSLYLTLSSNGEHKTDQGRAVRVSPALGFVSVEGSF